jgi:hypothetical protein
LAYRLAPISFLFLAGSQKRKKPRPGNNSSQNLRRRREVSSSDRMVQNEHDTTRTFGGSRGGLPLKDWLRVNRVDGGPARSNSCPMPPRTLCFFSSSALSRTSRDARHCRGRPACPRPNGKSPWVFLYNIPKVWRSFMLGHVRCHLLSSWLATTLPEDLTADTLQVQWTATNAHCNGRGFMMSDRPAWPKA